MRARRHSVYRIAAALSPSSEPKLPGPVDERIAQRERLRHADERLVERGVAVRVIVAHHVADHLRALPMLDVGSQILLPHREQDAPLNRLHAVADIRQRARRDDRQRVVEVSRLRRLVQRNHRRIAPARPRALRLDCGVAVFRLVEQRAAAFGSFRQRASPPKGG